MGSTTTLPRLGRGPRAMLLGIGIVAAGVLPGFLNASLAPRIDRDFSFGAPALGVAVSVFYVSSMLMSVPAGNLVDRFGARRGLHLSGATTATAALAIAALADSVAMLVALLVLAGAGNALAGPSVSALLRREVPVTRQGLAFGLQQAAAPAGALAAGLALPVVAIPFGWRWAFVATAVLAIVAAVAAPSALAGPRPASSGSSGRRPHARSVRLLAVSAGFASAAGVGLVSFIVLYAVDRGFTESQAGLLLAGLSLGAAASRIALGAVADRLGHDGLRLVAVMLATSAVGYVLLLTGRPPAIVAGALLAGWVGWAWPGALTLAVVRLSPQTPAWAVGAMMSGLFAGAFGGPLAVGLLAGRGSYAGAWLMCSALAMAAAATVVGAGRLARRRTQEPAGLSAGSGGRVRRALGRG